MGNDIHHHRSIHLTEFDYSRTGVYYVTVCAHGRECLFGVVVDDAMRLDDFGEIVPGRMVAVGGNQERSIPG